MIKGTTTEIANCFWFIGNIYLNCVQNHLYTKMAAKVLDGVI